MSWRHAARQTVDSCSHDLETFFNLWSQCTVLLTNWLCGLCQHRWGHICQLGNQGTVWQSILPCVVSLSEYHSYCYALTTGTEDSAVYCLWELIPGQVLQNSMPVYSGVKACLGMRSMQAVYLWHIKQTFNVPCAGMWHVFASIHVMPTLGSEYLLLYCTVYWHRSTQCWGVWTCCWKPSRRNSRTLMTC